MKYWLMKSEPGCYSWDEMKKDKTAEWDGVRNYQARNNMKSMKIGDKAFFYHSAIKEPHIAGVVSVCKLYYPDPTDKTGKFGMVDVKAEKALKEPITLKAIKDNPKLKDMALLKQSRLSVSPVTKAEWDILCKMAKL